MENGSIADAVIANRGLNFAGPYGGGYGYGGGGYGREFANDGSNAVRINSNAALNSQGQDFISQKIDDNADRNRDSAQVSSNTASFNRLNDKISDQTRFFTNEINLVSRDLANHARDSAKCCCEAKLLAVTNQAKTDAGMAQILANQSADVRVAEAVANAQQNAKLDTLLAA